MSDRIALMAMDWLREAGLAVPEDVSIVGFDGVDAARMAEPPLTTITQPSLEIGRRTVNYLSRAEAPLPRVILPTELTVRRSTGGTSTTSPRHPTIPCSSCRASTSCRASPCRRRTSRPASSSIT